MISKYRILQELEIKNPSKISKNYNITLSTFKGWIKIENNYTEHILLNAGKKQRLIGEEEK